VLNVGSEVGWLGFPSITPNTLCFFSGNISAWWEASHTYLIDGVAISGVSGGPVLCVTNAQPQIVGTISAYRAGEVSGATTPGLAFAQDVSHLHDVASGILSIEEEIRQQQQTQEQPPIPTPPTEHPN